MTQVVEADPVACLAHEGALIEQCARCGKTPAHCILMWRHSQVSREGMREPRARHLHAARTIRHAQSWRRVRLDVPAHGNHCVQLVVTAAIRPTDPRMPGVVRHGVQCREGPAFGLEAVARLHGVLQAVPHVCHTRGDAAMHESPRPEPRIGHPGHRHGFESYREADVVRAGRRVTTGEFQAGAGEQHAPRYEGCIVPFA